MPTGKKLRKMESFSRFSDFMALNLNVFYFGSWIISFLCNIYSLWRRISFMGSREVWSLGVQLVCVQQSLSFYLPMSTCFFNIFVGRTIFMQTFQAWTVCLVAKSKGGIVENIPTGFPECVLIKYENRPYYYSCIYDRTSNKQCFRSTETASPEIALNVTAIDL